MLKRLELLGFKSFASRSVFEFEAGISALVGPNGSGKSNVADAVRWVLGEQSGKALRGKKAEEVIFVGSAERHPLGMAEVALVLENGDRRLPLDFSEVRLARRLYRSGESEYLINGAQARRKDLLSLLLQVGLHAEGYTVIGQGAVDELILQKPDERRGVLEQAAEISRHQIRLSEARAKLAATAQNLTRCHDLIAELEPYARRLRVQAEKAESYTARRAQLAALAGTYYRAALAEKATDHKWAASELVRVKEECQRLEQEIASLDQQRLNARQEAAALDAQLNGLQGRLSELHQERDAQMAALASDRQQAGFLDARLEALTGQASRAAQRITQLAEEKGAAELDASAELSVSGVERLRRLETLVDELTAELGRARSHLEAARNDQTRVAEERERMQFEDDALRERQACQREEAAQIEARRAVLKAQLDENVSLSERLERELVAAREAALAVSADLSVAQQARAAVSRELFTLREREQKLNADVEVARAACEAIRLEAADADRGLPHSSGNGLHTNRDTLTPGPPLPPGRQEGPGERDTANGKRPNDSPGQRLGSSLTVAPEYEPAIAAALGEWARAELVADPDEAHSFVASESNGRELFIARAADGDAGPVFGTRFLRRVEQALVGIPYRPAAQVVGQRSNGHGSVPLGPLAFTVIVPDLEAANLARERLSAVVEQPWQISTLGGQVITHLGGWARGSESTADRLVSLRRREMAAHSRLEELEGALDQAARRRAEAETGLSQAEKRELDLRADQFSAEAQTRSLSSRREDLGAQRRRLEDALASLGPPAQLVDSRAAVSGADNVSRRQELAQIASSLKDKERAATEALHELQARWEAAWSEREQARRLVERAAAERRAREEVAAARARELERLEEEKLTATEQAQRASVEQTAIRTRLQACEANAARLAAAIADVVGAFDDLAVRRSALGAASDELDAAVAALRRQLAEAQQSREGTLLSSQQAADELSRLREEADAIAEEWGLAGSAVVQLALTGANAQPASPPAGASLPAPEHGSAADEAVAPPEIDLVTTRRRLLALQRELRADGGPSESVLDEYREVDERLRFLKGQSADLRTAMQEMEDAIAELEGMMRREFTAAFERVNGAFGQTFARLFGGGTARLMLTDPDQPLQTGVEVVAQPPGKRLQNLMSLSGGERALTSTALIFALLAINPLPFCVLDEVDAALDESNARRFAALLQEYAQRTQFIIITHNRATMEIAAALYGISMGGDGVTTVVSLRPSEAFAYA